MDIFWYQEFVLDINHKDFHIDFTHDDLKTAIESWQHLCRELPLETDVEIRKQTIEVVMSKKVDSATNSVYDSSQFTI